MTSAAGRITLGNRRFPAVEINSVLLPGQSAAGGAVEFMGIEIADVACFACQPLILAVFLRCRNTLCVKGYLFTVGLYDNIALQIRSV